MSKKNNNYSGNSWNEMSYNRYKNRKNEYYTEKDEYKNKLHIYEDYYNDSTFSVEDLFYINDDNYFGE